MLRRPDAQAIALPDQGTPALLDSDDEVGAIADFMTEIDQIERGGPRNKSAGDLARDPA